MTAGPNAIVFNKQKKKTQLQTNLACLLPKTKDQGLLLLWLPGTAGPKKGKASQAQGMW